MSGSVLGLCKGGTLLQILLIPAQPVVSVCVFWQAYSLVGNNCSQSSNIPATVCVGHCFQLLSHQKHPSKLRLVSSLLKEVSFPCQFVHVPLPMSSVPNPFSALPSVSLLLSPLHYRALCKLGSSCNWRPISSAYLDASLTKELCRPNSSALSSNFQMLSLLKNIGRINVTCVPSGIITFYNILSACNIVET